MSAYTHVARGQLAKALNVLPNLSQLTAETTKRTGTDDCAASSGAAEHSALYSAPNGAERLVSTQRDAMTAEAGDPAVRAGSPGGTRENAIPVLGEAGVEPARSYRVKGF